MAAGRPTARAPFPGSEAGSNRRPSSRIAGAVRSTAGRIGDSMPELDWRPARAHERVPIDGETVRLEPLDAKRHGEDLFAAAAGADGTWYYLPYGPFPTRSAFGAWLQQHAGTQDPLALAILDREAGAPRALAPRRVRGLAVTPELRRAGTAAPIAGPGAVRNRNTPIGVNRWHMAITEDRIQVALEHGHTIDITTTGRRTRRQRRIEIVFHN